MGDRGPQPPELPDLQSVPMKRNPLLIIGGLGAKPPVYIFFKITYFVISSHFSVCLGLRSYNQQRDCLHGAPGAFLPAYYNTGWRVLHVGGNWNNGSNAGLFYFNANNTSSNTNSNVGTRLLVFLSLCRLFLTAW